MSVRLAKSRRTVLQQVYSIYEQSSTTRRYNKKIEVQITDKEHFTHFKERLVNKASERAATDATSFTAPEPTSALAAASEGSAVGANSGIGRSETSFF